MFEFTLLKIIIVNKVYMDNDYKGINYTVKKGREIREEADIIGCNSLTSINCF